MKRKASTPSTQAIKRIRPTPVVPRQNFFQQGTRGRREERKNIDTTSTAMVVFNQTTANVLFIGSCIEGSSPLTHTGRHIDILSAQYRFTVHLAATTTGSSAIRFMMVYDRQPNGSQAGATAVLVADNIHSPMQLQNSMRFVVLFDDTQQCIGTAGPQAFIMKGYKKGLHLPVEFNSSNGGNVGDIQTGAVSCYCWQDGGLLVASPVNQLYTRLRFRDA